MCNFKPFNKHVLVENIAEEKIADSSPVLIPHDAKVGNDERFKLVGFIAAASDCDQFLLNMNRDQPGWATQTGTMDDRFLTSGRQNGHMSLVVDNSMIEEINLSGRTHRIIHQNYIVGIIDE